MWQWMRGDKDVRKSLRVTQMWGTQEGQTGLHSFQKNQSGHSGQRWGQEGWDLAAERDVEGTQCPSAAAPAARSPGPPEGISPARCFAYNPAAIAIAPGSWHMAGYHSKCLCCEFSPFIFLYEYFNGRLGDRASG